MAATLTLAFAAFLFAPAAAIADKGGDGIVFIGLRPVADAEGSETDIHRIGESQQIRSVVENVLEAITSKQVAGHDALRKAIGSAYLVDVFDCGGNLPCLRKLIAPLARQGYDTAVVGEYRVDGAKYQVKLTSFSILETGGEPQSVTITVAKDEVESTKAWRAGVERLLANVGRVAIATNVQDFRCTLDGRPCSFDTDGKTLVVDPGEHALQLSAKGYRAASRVLTVTAGSTQRIAVALDELPIQLQAAPSRLTENRGASDHGFAMFGKISWSALLDPINQGDDFDDLSPPPELSAREWNAGGQLFTILGGSWTTGEVSGWQASAQIVVGLIVFRRIRIPESHADIAKPDKGFRLAAGRFYNPILNTLEPGLLGGSLMVGSLFYALDGMTASQTVGPIVAQLGVGRPESVAKGETPPLQSVTGPPMVESKVSYVSRHITGILYGQTSPLTLSVSAAVGEGRVGPGEDLTALDPNAAPARVEDLPVLVGSVEALIPLDRFVLVGEYYQGQGAGFYGGAFFQHANVDLATGRHSSLRSRGMWAQLSYRPTDDLEILAMAGRDYVYSGLDHGVNPTGDINVRSNLRVAAATTMQLTRACRIGLQIHYDRSEFVGFAPSSNYGSVFELAYFVQ